MKNTISFRQIILIAVGSALYAASLNLFLTPLHLYAGGIPGLSQMLRTIFFSDIHSVDMAGILNFCFNVPLFILAYKTMKPRTVIGTAFSVVIQTILISLLPIPAHTILDDKLACILIAGAAGGFGCGLVLSNGATAGGMDLLGLFLAQHTKIQSIGRVSLVFNCVLYTAMALMFDLQTAVYSLIFIVAFSIVMDRSHEQNIEIELTVFTRNSEVLTMLMKEFGRGVTTWQGKGAYTDHDMHILICVIDKKEQHDVIMKIQKLDPQAFIIANDQVHVTGGFQKRLI